MGTHSITVSYPGDSYNGPSVSAPLNQVVKQAQTATTVTATPSPGIAGGPETITATVTVTAGSGTPTGTVTFTSGTTQLGSAPVSNTGTATITPALAQGSYQIVATYSGDANNQGSASAPLSSHRGAGNHADRTRCRAQPGAGAGVHHLYRNRNGQRRSAHWQRELPRQRQCDRFGDPEPRRSRDLHHRNIGSWHLRHHRRPTPAMPMTPRSTSLPVSLTVSLATTATAITVTPNPALVGAAVTITAKVTGNGGTPTGSVNFIANGNTLASANLTAGTASFTTSTLAPGTYSITVSYQGDPADAPSTSTAISETVGLIPTTTSLGSSTTTGTTPQVDPGVDGLE